MPQATLFDATEPEALAFDTTGFEIGWDHAQHRLVPPVQHLHAGSPVRQGWQAGRALFGTRTLRVTRHVRKWLQLRLNAWVRGRAFEGQTVTPHFLAQIEVAECPVTREPLTHATGAPSDASVDRVNNDAGYAAGNLAVMSVRANAAKADHAWDAALAVVRELESSGRDAFDGLSAAQWSRLAVLMSYVTPLAHGRVACLPLLVLPPNRLRLLNPVQALQTLLTLQFTRPGAPKRVAELAGVVPAPARDAFQVFMHTLLARRLAAGANADGPALRRAMEDAWLHPLVNRRWQRFALQLTESDCERLVQYAGRRGLAGDGWRWLPREAATEGWALDTRGYACEAAKPTLSRAAAAAAAKPRGPMLAHRAAPPHGAPCSLS